jgi:NAD(P)-dependent dehydrogenase (short-subunit alcohol dehydrogenase family)
MGNRTLMMLSQALGARSVEHGVRVLAINPGLIATDRMLSLLQAKAELLLGDGKRWEELLTIQPMNRAGTVDEVAPMAAFLLSRHAAYISGTVVTIDAGHSQRVDLF